MLESEFQTKLKKEIADRLPGCLVLKQDAGQRQGIPDLLVLHGKHWAALEVKRGPKEKFQPNQEYYVKRLGEMSFAAVVHPQNYLEVIDDLQAAFGA